MYSLALDGNYIVAALHGASGDTIITKPEYDELKAVIFSAPIAPDGYIYQLRADNREWELVESPYSPPVEDDDLTDSEILAILLGEGEEE